MNANEPLRANNADVRKVAVIAIIIKPISNNKFIFDVKTNIFAGHMHC